MMASISPAPPATAALLYRLLLEQEGEVVGGAERPFAGDAHEIDAAPA